jgi:hypothetical protein
MKKETSSLRSQDQQKVKQALEALNWLTHGLKKSRKKSSAKKS